MAEKKRREYDFYGARKYFVIVPAAILVVALIVLAIFKVDVAIEFKGGTMLTYSFTSEIDTDAVQTLVEAENHGTVRVSTGSSFGSDLETMTVSFASNEGLTADVQSALTNKLQESFPENDLILVNSQDVNPSTGASFFLKCLVAVVFSFIVLVIYIALRFKKIGGWSAGVFAVVALLTDVFMVAASFVIFRFSIDANFMAVVLAVLGYSLNSTIVVYDRMRENRTLYGTKLSYAELVNKSANQSLTRSLNTTITTGAAVVVICIVSLVFNVSTITSFVFPLLIGLISGFFSSLGLASTLWASWQQHKIKTGKMDRFGKPIKASKPVKN